MRHKFHVGAGVLAIAMITIIPVQAGQITVDFTKPVFVKAFKKVCVSDEELDAMVKGAPAKCFQVKADLPLTVLDTHMTGFLGSGSMHVKGRSDALTSAASFYVDAEDLKNASVSEAPKTQVKRIDETGSAKLNWGGGVVARPGARACIYLHFPTWEDAKECHSIQGDVEVVRVDQPPFQDWVRVTTTDDTGELAFYIKIKDLENYRSDGQSWSKEKGH